MQLQERCSGTVGRRCFLHSVQAVFSLPLPGLPQPAGLSKSVCLLQMRAEQGRKGWRSRRCRQNCYIKSSEVKFYLFVEFFIYRDLETALNRFGYAKTKNVCQKVLKISINIIHFFIFKIGFFESNKFYMHNIRSVPHKNLCLTKVLHIKFMHSIHFSFSFLSFFRTL